MPQRTTVHDLLSPTRLRLAVACARQTRTPVRFALRELLAPAVPGRRGALRRYRRPSGLAFCVRHGTQDLGVLVEVLLDDLYRLPAPAAARLDARRPVAVLDLGAHIGLFGVRALEQLAGARILAYEPDPGNHRALRATLAANDLGDRWTARDACAAAAPGRVRFAAGRGSGSRALDGEAHPEGGAILDVPAVDVLPDIAAADLVKIDIEGGEWAILADPRLADAVPAVLALEYHRHLCPAADPRGLAEATLLDLGYATESVSHDEAAGVGTLWAWRAAGAQRRASTR